MSDGVPLKTMRLVVFFTKGLSLREWRTRGLLDRELLLYRRLRPQVGGIVLLTYGDAKDLALAPEGIEVLCNRWRLPEPVYWRLAPLLHWKALARADVFKTNQTHGAEAAVWAGRWHPRARLIARCGYLWSLNAGRAAGGMSSREYRMAWRREQAAFTRADRIVVTTELGRQYVISQHKVAPELVRVIPNYVDVELFAARSRLRQQIPGRRLVFVGRLHQEKNLFHLLEALEGLDVELVVIGEGPLRARLERVAAERALNVRWLGARPHQELPQHFVGVNAFILPSLYENHPKALLEAMASELAVIGTDVPGIRELIDHRRTGYLCCASPEGIRSAIIGVFSDRVLQAEMGRNARQYVVENFSVERILEKELGLLHEMSPGAVDRSP